MGTDSKIYFGWYDPYLSALNTVSSVGALTDGKWHHAVGTHDGTNGKLYIDGVLQGTGTGPSQSFTGWWRIGGYTLSTWSNGSDGYFEGALDDVRIYNRALSATEIKQLYNLGQAKIGHSNIAISNGLVGYWTFDGQDVNWATGKAKDLSGSGFDGQLQDFSTSTSPSVGKAGQAMGFNGSTSFIDNGDVLRLTSGNFSIAAWTFVTSNVQQFFVFHGLGCLNWTSYYLSIGGLEDEDTGKYGFGFGTADAPADNRVASTMNAITGRWVHLVGAYNGSALSLYVDGQLNNSAAASGNPWNSSNHLYFGADPGCGGARYVINGKMDDVRIYNRALSAAEVKQLYKSGAVTIGHSDAIISNGLVGYWTFDGPSIDWHTNTVSDMSGQGNTGSLVSMSTTSSPTPGKIGQALNFDNTRGTYVSANDSSSLDSINKTVTLAAWVKYRTFLDAGIVAKDSLNPSTPYATYGLTTGCGNADGNQFTFTTDSLINDGCGVFSNTLMTLNKWYHVAGTFDGSYLRLYVNGVLDNSEVYASSSIMTNDANLIIGGYYSTDYLTDGSIDDVRIYNRALSAQEVQQLYNAGH